MKTTRRLLLPGAVAALVVLAACAPLQDTAPTPTPPPTPTAVPVTVNLEDVGAVVVASPAAGPGDPGQIYVVTFDASKIVERVMPAVVTVINEQRFSQGVFGETEVEAGRGTGFIIDGSGNIVTNEHVVRGGTGFQVILSNGEKRNATLVGSDPLSDLAVVRMEGPPPSTVTFGDSDSLRQGQPVLAIGSPLGEFTGTVTSGVISALNRDFPASAGTIGGEGIYTDLIQHDAAINPGNSGGPLFDLAGRVIGVNTLGIPQSGVTPVQGLFFAIPANRVADIASQLIENGQVVVSIHRHRVSTDLARSGRAERSSGRLWRLCPGDGPGGPGGAGGNPARRHHPQHWRRADPGPDDLYRGAVRPVAWRHRHGDGAARQ